MKGGEVIMEETTNQEDTSVVEPEVATEVTETREPTEDANVVLEGEE